MKNNNKHLDDYFAKARQDEPVISQEHARDVIAKHEHLPTTPIIFSTKGILMSTIGLSLAAFIGYLALSATPEQPLIKQSAINSPTQQLIALPTARFTEEPAKHERKVEQKIVVINTPAKVEGIKPIELPASKFAAMGLTKKSDGAVSFSQKNENGKIFTMSFPQNSWGITLDDMPEVTDAPRFAPMIVTDTKGNKRLMQFSSESYGKKIRAMQINSRAEDEEIDPSKISELIKNAIKIGGKFQIGGNDGDVDYLKVGLDSNEIKNLRDAIKIVAEVNQNGEEISANPKKMQMHIVVNSDKSISDTSSNGKHRKMVVKMDRHIQIDSSLNASSQQIERATKELTEVITKLHLEKLDSLGEKLNQLKLENDIDVSDNEISNIDLDLADIQKRMNDLNNLIPVLVRQASSEHADPAEGITYDDGLIFWYNPDKALSAIVTEAEQKQTTPTQLPTGNAILTKSVLFPNPAKLHTTLHFSLSEPRTLVFSIHDLLGKRVKDGGSITEIAAGSYQHEINLSSLTAGVYLLVITTDKGEQTMQRLVIEK
ncbi:MAG: T9SS type A sorting domain-containing protein [bacterium]